MSSHVVFGSRRPEAAEKREPSVRVRNRQVDACQSK